MLFTLFATGSVQYRLLPREERTKSPLFVAAAAVIWLMVGLRFEVGADWTNYLEIYDTVIRSTVLEAVARGDPAYMLLNALAGYLGLGVWLVNLICAGLFTWGLLIFARRQPNPWLALAVAVPYLVIVVAMGYTRQAVAIGMLMAAIGEFERQRYGRFALLILFAACFHKSVVLILPLIGLSVIRQRFAVYVGMAIIGTVAFSLFLNRFVDTLFSTYVSQDLGSQGAAVRIAMNIVPALLYLSNSRRFAVSEQERVIWRNFAIAVVLTLVGLPFLPSTALDRFALYLIPIQIVVLSRLPYAFPSRGLPNAQVTIAVLFYSAAVQLVWLQFAKNASYWLPYRMSVG